MSIVRQGDVLLIPVQSIPDGCKDVPLENGRIVLMHGEATGHAHAISDFVDMDARSHRTTAKIIDMAKARARLLAAPDGNRYLEVKRPVNLKHEEHSPIGLPPGLYQIPVQVEWTTERMVRQVAD